MKSYLQPKSHRLRIDTNIALYTSLILILMSTLLMIMAPLLRQPLPLHELAQIKTHAISSPIVITISPTHEYQLNTEMDTQKFMTLEAIKESLIKQFKLMDPKQTSICIKSAPTISYGKVIEMIDWLEAQGAQHIGLLTTAWDNPEPIS